MIQLTRGPLRVVPTIPAQLKQHHLGSSHGAPNRQPRFLQLCKLLPTKLPRLSEERLLAFGRGLKQFDPHLDLLKPQLVSRIVLSLEGNGQGNLNITMLFEDTTRPGQMGPVMLQGLSTRTRMRTTPEGFRQNIGSQHPTCNFTGQLPVSSQGSISSVASEPPRSSSVTQITHPTAYSKLATPAP